MIFNSLSLQLQRRIDHAFDETVQSVQRDHTYGLEFTRGFFVEQEKLGGGFITDSQPSQVSQQIPLSSIPSALQCLDLPPDDEQVLSVFRNAASGWTSSSNDVFGDGPGILGEGTVSRDDWRSVCAVLFEHHEQEYADDSGPMDLDASHKSGGEMESDTDDQLLVSASGNTDDSSDDEYIEVPAVSSSRRRTHTRQTKDESVSSPSPPPKLSLRQQKTCLDTFALFFPSVPSSQVANQKIMIKDIQRVSKLLGEKIKTNEVCFIFSSFQVCPPIFL